MKPIIMRDGTHGIPEVGDILDCSNMLSSTVGNKLIVGSDGGLLLPSESCRTYTTTVARVFETEVTSTSAFTGVTLQLDSEATIGDGSTMFSAYAFLDKSPTGIIYWDLELNASDTISCGVVYSNVTTGAIAYAHSRYQIGSWSMPTKMLVSEQVTFSTVTLRAKIQSGSRIAAGSTLKLGIHIY